MKTLSKHTKEQQACGAEVQPSVRPYILLGPSVVVSQMPPTPIAFANRIFSPFGLMVIITHFSTVSLDGNLSAASEPELHEYLNVALGEGSPCTRFSVTKPALPGL